MEFSVGRQTILTELNLLQGVVERKTTIPILTNVLIEASGQSELSLIATDLDVSLQTECAAQVSAPGSVVVQAKKLFDIVKNLSAPEIVFRKEDGDWVKILSGSSQFRIVGHAREHFPSTPQAGKTGIRIPSDLLHSLITRTMFAITQEESRYALGGSLFLISGSTALMVATDGHRLAMSSCAVEEQSEEKKAIIPRKALSELQKLTAASPDSAAEFSKDENHLFFKIGQRSLTSRMLAGQFPNYDIVIPKNNDKILKFSLDKISQAIKRAALMADERSHGVKFEFEDGSLTITSQTADLGESHEVVQVDYNNEKVAAKVNANYLLEFFSVVDTENILLEIKDDQTPVLFKPDEGSKYNYKYVVMPMRL